MSVSIIPQLKKKKTNHQFATIYIRGYYNRKAVASITTGKIIQLQHWDPVNRQLYSNAPHASLINTIIKTKVQAMEKALLQKEVMGTSINRQHVIKAVKSIDDSKDFYRFCWQQICLYPNKETQRCYNTEVTKMKQFQKAVSFADLDYSFLTRYKKYMQDKLHNQPNTVWKSFKFMSTMINKALKHGGIINENPFNEFDRGTYTQGKPKWLEMADCMKIENKLKDMGDGNTYKTALYFLLMAYSGMRFSDAMLFNPDTHIDGDRIVMTYQKFNTAVDNKMHDKLVRIVELVKHHRLLLSNQKFNQHLKIVAGICQIDLTVRSHVARHTMGGLLAELNIPEEQARIIMGHKKINSTRIYYHVKDKNLDAAMDKFNTL